MVRDERAPWQNPKIISTLTLVFLAGVVMGALSMRLMHQLPSHASGPVGREAVLNRFKAELDLSPPQSERIAQVLDDYRLYYDSLQEQLDDLRATGKTRIIQILNPEQRIKFQKMMTDLDPVANRAK